MMVDRQSRIIINGLFLDHPRTGTGVYTREVVRRLGATTPTNGTQYIVVGHPEHAAGHDRAGIARYVSLQGPGRARSSKMEKVVWEQTLLPLAAKRLHADLLYAPYFSLPLAAPAPTVVTIHDLIPLLLPEYAPTRGFAAYFKLVSAATRRANAVVTDSEHSAGDIARVLGIPRERIHVLYLGVDPQYVQPVGGSRIEEVRRRLGLPDRFLLYLGGTDPRKNIDTLLYAAQAARKDMLPLALVAPPGGRFADPRHLAARLGLGATVTFLDWVSEADKAPLYAAATAFVYPSRYEGFGLPPLEAMACGTPVVCSRASSLPEVVGDAGLLLEPDDVDGWADALVRISNDAHLQAMLSTAGQARAARFTWDSTVSGLQAVFHTVVTAHAHAPGANL